MAGLIRQELLNRLKDDEDSFVERKLEGDDLKRTIVAFANSVPSDREAILYIGVRNDGAISGVTNADATQKKIHKICFKDCYPPIKFSTEILRIDDKPVLAVIIPSSLERPHFAGQAFIRVGTESIPASKELFDDLITSRHSKAGELLKYKGKIVIVISLKAPLGRPQFPQTAAGTTLMPRLHEVECTIEAVNPFFARLVEIGGGRRFSEPLANIELSYNEVKNRLMVIVRLDQP